MIFFKTMFQDMQITDGDTETNKCCMELNLVTLDLTFSIGGNMTLL